MSEPYADVRANLWPRTLLALVCRISGHRPAWIEAIVPNPYASDSRVWGCARCSRTLGKPK